MKITVSGSESIPVQVDGEAWLQQPGVIYITHKNRAQMLTRHKVITVISFVVFVVVAVAATVVVINFPGSNDPAMVG